MIIPLILAGIRGGLALAELGVNAYEGARQLWRGKGPAPGAQGSSQPLSFRDVEQQREQMRRATAHGSPLTPAPDTARSFTILPPKG